MINIQWRQITEKYIVFIVFSIGFIIRIIPEIKAYPYPIGYDVINHYIPNLMNVHSFETFIIDNFNPYLYILYLSNILLNNPQLTVTLLISLMYGFFSISLYLFNKKITNNQYHCLFITIFVIIQIPVLRTSWDLHKDIFALTIMFVIFYILLNYKIKLIQFIILLTLTIITIMTDIMVSLVLILTLIIYNLKMNKEKRKFKYLLILILGLYILLFSLTIENNIVINNITKLILNENVMNSNYSQVNLGIMFFILYILILPTFIVGINILRNDLVYIPLVITLIGSFTWIFISNTDLLLPDRWIILSTIFSSIVSGYGMIYLLKKLRKNLQKSVSILILGSFLIISINFMIFSSNQNMTILNLFSTNVKYFVPISMQFNSVNIEDNEDLINAIDWINMNTERNATIIGDKHLRGWMNILLKEDRSYQFNGMIFNNNTTYVIYVNDLDNRSDRENLKSFGVFQIEKITT